MRSADFAAISVYHLQVAELRNVLLDGVIQSELAILNQGHGGHTNDWLGHRKDSEDRLAVHQIAARRCLESCRFEQPDSVGIANQNQGARNKSPVDCFLHPLFDVVYIRLIELENRGLNHSDGVFFMMIGACAIRDDAETYKGSGTKAVSKFHESDPGTSAPPWAQM